MKKLEKTPNNGALCLLCDAWAEYMEIKQIYKSDLKYTDFYYGRLTQAINTAWHFLEILPDEWELLHKMSQILRD